MGGEKRRLSECAQWAEGSPPRGRGKAQRLLSHSDPLGITPAWAGKRAMDALPSAPAGDHPRVGGEKVVQSVGTAPESGSPPRGRGKDFLFLDRLFAQRITPAWAGKRYLPPSLCSGSYGSPPRGRGKEPEVFFGLVSYRITPAWAGKSQRRPHDHLEKRDHPRVGGEKCTAACSESSCSGSPPRGRGKGLECRLARFQSRITPAWAGKRVCQRFCAVVLQDHPRVGGEKTS